MGRKQNKSELEGIQIAIWVEQEEEEEEDGKNLHVAFFSSFIDLAFEREYQIFQFRLRFHRIFGSDAGFLFANEAKPAAPPLIAAAIPYI